jgi:hypothetical protein
MVKKIKSIRKALFLFRWVLSRFAIFNTLRTHKSKSHIFERMEEEEVAQENAGKRRKFFEREF